MSAIHVTDISTHLLFYFFHFFVEFALLIYGQTRVFWKRLRPCFRHVIHVLKTRTSVVDF